MIEEKIPQIKPTKDNLDTGFTTFNFENPIDNDVCKDSCIRYIYSTIKRAVEGEIKKRNDLRLEMEMLFHKINYVANELRQPGINLFNGVLSMLHMEEREPYSYADIEKLVSLCKFMNLNEEFSGLSNDEMNLFKEAFEKIEAAIPQIKPTSEDSNDESTRFNFKDPIDDNIYKDWCVRYIHNTIKRAVEKDVERRLEAVKDPLDLTDQIISTDSEDNQINPIIPIDLTDSIDLENDQNIPINFVKPESEDFSTLPTDQAYQPIHSENLEIVSYHYFPEQLREADGREMEKTFNEGGYYSLPRGENYIEFGKGKLDYGSLQTKLQENFPAAQGVIKKIANARVFDEIFNWYYFAWLEKNPAFESITDKNKQDLNKLFIIKQDGKDKGKVTVSVIYDDIAIPRHTLRFECDISITIDGEQPPVVEIDKEKRPQIRLV